MLPILSRENIILAVSITVSAFNPILRSQMTVCVLLVFTCWFPHIFLIILPYNKDCGSSEWSGCSGAWFKVGLYPWDCHKSIPNLFKNWENILNWFRQSAELYCCSTHDPPLTPHDMYIQAAKMSCFTPHIYAAATTCCFKLDNNHVSINHF